MNFAMWAQALRTIPRVSKAEWDRLDVISRWLIASRSAVLVMTFISAAIAGILAFAAGLFDLRLWLLVTLGLVMAHATNNLLNDVTDSLRGVDRGNYFRSRYGPQPIEHGLLTMREMLVYAAITGLAALAAGIYLVWATGWPTLLLLALGAFFVLFYTFPLEYVGLGEPAVLVVWGPLMVGGGYYVIAGAWSWNVVLASLPYALGVTTVIFGKHIDKIPADREKGIYTLPVLLGERLSRGAAISMMALQYAFVLYLVLTGFFTPVMLLVLLALPMFRDVLKVYLKPRPEEVPQDPRLAALWPLWFVNFAFVHNRRFGVLFLCGLILEALLRGVL
ncbi:prenyltransferase [Rubrobacter taiwanensis]|nr:prenyltransferase [Rubrobacter taiwanensis]